MSRLIFPLEWKHLVLGKDTVCMFVSRALMIIKCDIFPSKSKGEVGKEVRVEKRWRGMWRRTFSP